MGNRSIHHGVEAISGNHCLLEWIHIQIADYDRIHMTNLVFGYFNFSSQLSHEAVLVSVLRVQFTRQMCSDEKDLFPDRHY